MRMYHFFSFFLLPLLISCSSSGNPSVLETDTNGPAAPDEGTSLPDPGGNGREPSNVAVETEWVEASGKSIFVQYYRPLHCAKGAPCAAVLLVPDKLNAGVDEFACCGQKLAATLDATVITYNPPGRGVEGEQTSGEEDYGGRDGQDVVKDVANSLRKRLFVDETDFGVVSLGNGVADASGALARFQATSLGFVGYFIDIEGPTNRCFITQSPFFTSDDGWYINADGPGASASRCDFEFFSRTLKFPAGTSSDGKGSDGSPNSYICHQNAFIIKETGNTCDTDLWWNEREAKHFLKKLDLPYLRLQFKYDHEQPTRYAAREALRWLTIAPTDDYQLNSVTSGSNLQGYSEDEVLELGAYLDFGSAGNGFGTDVFDTTGEFKKMSKQVLLLSVLPQYIKKMRKKIP